MLSNAISMRSVRLKFAHGVNACHLLYLILTFILDLWPIVVVVVMVMVIVDRARHSANH